MRSPSRLIGFKLPKNHWTLLYRGCSGRVPELHTKLRIGISLPLNPEIAVFRTLFGIKYFIPSDIQYYKWIVKTFSNRFIFQDFQSSRYRFSVVVNELRQAQANEYRIVELLPSWNGLYGCKLSGHYKYVLFSS